MIFSIQKRKRRVKGVLKVARLYSLRYRVGDMPSDKWHGFRTPDKTVATSRANQFISDLEREMAGLAIPKTELKASNVPLGELIAEYRMELATRGRDATIMLHPRPSGLLALQQIANGSSFGM